MPSKIQLDENLWFLYICLQKSDFKTIDFNAVGIATNLNPPAARMRYTRLRRQIEGGTLIGTRGKPFHGGAEKIAQSQKKRKTGLPTSTFKDGEERDDDEEGEEEVQVLQTRSGSCIIRSAKIEASSTDASEWNDEDDLPLAKRRTADAGRSRKSIKSEPDRRRAKAVSPIAGVEERIPRGKISARPLPPPRPPQISLETQRPSTLERPKIKISEASPTSTFRHMKVEPSSEPDVDIKRDVDLPEKQRKRSLDLYEVPEVLAKPENFGDASMDRKQVSLKVEGDQGFITPKAEPLATAIKTEELEDCYVLESPLKSEPLERKPFS